MIANATAEQQQLAQAEQQNLQAHMAAVALTQAPPNYQNYMNAQAQEFLSSPAPMYINGMPISINPMNTQYIPVPASEYPSWFQPNPNWTYANGFTMGSLLQVGMNWIMGGWRPYYGQQPNGYVCATNYFPTPWTYMPANNTWMQPGVSTFMDSPNEGYTGPITVEVVEPVQTWMPDQWGHRVRTVANELYLYNAFYYPQFGRWGYVNRRNYFVWLNM